MPSNDLKSVIIDTLTEINPKLDSRKFRRQKCIYQGMDDPDCNRVADNKMKFLIPF
jgi:hypothetical protein